MRVSGHIGNWSVDLELKLEIEEIRQLAALLRDEASRPESRESSGMQPEVPVKAEGVGNWQLAQLCLRSAGQMEGPSLLAELAALAGSEQEGKRLLVRLRHAPEVALETQGATTLYRWIGQ